jgi:preprotein translocase subunit Sec61beta
MQARAGLIRFDESELHEAKAGQLEVVQIEQVKVG